MPNIKKIFTQEIADELRENLKKATRKHKSICAFAIFIEGNNYFAVVPEYDNDEQKKRDIRRLMFVLVQNKDLCDRFAQFVVPPARLHERNEKNARKTKRDKNEGLSNV